MAESDTESSPHQILIVLDLLKQASHSLHSNPTTNPNSIISALLSLSSLLSNDHSHSTLSSLLKSLNQVSSKSDLSSSFGFGMRRGRRRLLEISNLAARIEAELQSWIDRYSLDALVKSLLGFGAKSKDSVDSVNDSVADSVDSAGDSIGDSVVVDSSELTRLLTRLRERVDSGGFSRGLQDAVLRSRVLRELETVLCDGERDVGLREQCGLVIESLVRFNKNVFVAEVRMGKTTRGLIELNTTESLRIVCSLIRLIKSPLVDEIEANNGIEMMIELLCSKRVEIRVSAMECVFEIGYFGRKEAIEAMMGEGLVEKLVELQRGELGGVLIEMGRCGEGKSEDGGNVAVMSREEYLKWRPFASCVARFAVMLEVGEGLRRREKRAFKLEMLKRVREASISDAEAATIVAEVLWGSYP
ncbi:hypothetical protein Droror1_Dr00023911 [Drosera rotundifolia]